jgi:circadian clock protein KaiB
MGSILASPIRSNRAPKYQLRLFLTGRVEKSRNLQKNLEQICLHLETQYELDIVDVLQDPETAEKERIIATPTLIKYQPLPVKRIIGDLSNIQEVLFQIKED